jgi:phospholipid/cholesterol/gamma-HCH transport system substrate-binding protein
MNTRVATGHQRPVIINPGRQTTEDNLSMVFSEQRKIVVGGVVVIVTALVFGLLSGGGETSRTDSYTIEAKFNRIDGLVSDDEVRMGGVRIGTVGGQSLNEHYQAIVQLVINNGVLLPTDTSAAIHTDGLFGSKYVVLEPGGEEENLADGGTITFTQDSLIVSELLDLIISQGKQQAKEAAAAKAQIKEAQKILNGQKGED